MFTSFTTALSGLNAMTTAIDVVGNNLANLNTTGYKDNSVSFKDMVSEAVNGAGTQVGLGTRRPITTAQFLQGAIQTTNGTYDASITGQGFFVVKNGSGQDLYTRDGSFKVDTNGFLTTSTGEKVQGWSAANGAVNQSGALSDIQVPIGASLPPKATTKFSLGANLDASAQQGTAAGTVQTQVDTIDSLGNTVPLTVTFTKTATAGQWNYAVTGNGTTVTGGAGSLQFDSNGNLTNPTAAAGTVPLTVSGMSDGAGTMNIGWNLYDANANPQFTQFSEASGISTNNPDGRPAGQLTGVNLAKDGKVLATYSNGAQQQVVSQLALASIRNPTSLVDVGNNNFSLGVDTAAPAIGASNTGGRGVIEGGSLESSTVDIATEFSNLLTFQRSYQANSRVVTVSDQLSQETVNLVK